MTVETTDTRSCVYLDCVVQGQSNKGNIKVSALQASVLLSRALDKYGACTEVVDFFFYSC